MAGPTITATKLPHDADGRYFGHLWDTASNKGLAQRAVNPDGTNGVGDAAVVLYDASGNALLTTAAAMADGVANPTVGRLGVHPMLFNGSTWDRLRSASAVQDPLSTPALPVEMTVSDGANLRRVQPPSATADGSNGQNSLAVGPMLFNGSTWVRQRVAASNADPGAIPAALVHDALAHPGSPTFNLRYDAASTADGSTGANSPSEMPMLFNGTTWDRQRGNVAGTGLASSARTATASSSDIVNYNHRGVIVFLDATATPNNAETLTLAIQAKDPVSGKYVSLTAFTALTASGLGATPTTATFLYTLVPGGAETAAIANHEVQALTLPRTWRVTVTHSSSGSWTYSVGYSLLV